MDKNITFPVPTTGASNKRICKKFVKIELDDVTRDPEDWITKLKLLSGDQWKLGVNIDDVGMMTHILSNLRIWEDCQKYRIITWWTHR